MHLAISYHEDQKAVYLLTSSRCTEMQTALQLTPFKLVLFPNSCELFRFFLLNTNKYNYVNFQAMQVIEANKPQQG